jgi:hypothetical protein
VHLTARHYHHPITSYTARGLDTSRKRFPHHNAKMANMDIDFTRRNKKPRLLTDSERDKLDEFVDSIHYSSR